MTKSRSLMLDLFSLVVVLTALWVAGGSPLYAPMNW